TVKISVVTSGQTFGAHDELLNQLGRKLELLQTDRDRSSVTMLFCPITSRVGSDVEAAMSNLSGTGDQNVILVLMHHTRDPSYSTAGTDWADVYPNVISSVHVLFHESVPGLLTCSQNNMAVDQMLRKL
uniref:AIG1-type G domain-containing protein n=1 Tax=Poecilia formosa TaxID=48698 RepID=A0A096LPQ9_POEFO